jgi:hypothetical protein
MAKTKPGMNINEDDTMAESTAVSEPRLRQGNQPICPVHQIQMVSYATNKLFTYYKCTHGGCKETDKRLRPVGPLKNKYGFGKSAQKEE